jgi:hypothetical protein
LKYINKSIIPFLISSLLTLSINANEPKEKKSWFDATLEALGLDDDTFDESKVIDFSIIPGPFYNPEMSFGIGVSAVGLYRADKEDKETQLSSLVINGFGSVNGSFGMSVKNKTFLNQDDIRLYIDGNAYRAVETYYGVGYDNNKNDGNAFDYDRDQFELMPTLFKRIFSNTFIGGGAHANYTTGQGIVGSTNSQTPTPTGAVSFPNSYKIVGLTVKAFHDSRDFVLNAREGRLIDFGYTHYDDSFGGDSDFKKIEFEWNEYFALNDEANDILAFQLRTETNQGEVPWDQFAMIGGSNGLRGYYEGRYRDNTMILSQLEWRHRIRKPHGVVLWGGGALIGDDYSSLRDAEVLNNFGVGYRLEVKERVNVRFDYGVGDGESGFYMNISEAF